MAKGIYTVDLTFEKIQQLFLRYAEFSGIPQAQWSEVDYSFIEMAAREFLEVLTLKDAIKVEDLLKGLVVLEDSENQPKKRT